MVKSVRKKSSLQMKKSFTVEETFNKQNNKVYAQSSKEARKLVPWIDPVSVIWWGGITFLHFCEKGVKTAARNYQQDILTNVVEPLN